MTFGSLGYGAYQAGEKHLLTVANNTPRNNTRLGIIACHGHGGDATQFSQYTSAQGAHIKALADAGAIVMSIDAGGTTPFGNAAVMTAITNAYNWLTGAGGGAKSPKVAMFGWSMGGLSCLNWIKRNPAKVAGAWLWTPATDLDFFHGTAGYTPAYSPGSVAAGAYTAEIDTAYGGSASYAANSAGYRVRDEYASWKSIGVPIKIATAVDDSTIPVGQSRDGFVAGVNDPLVTFRSVPSGNHSGLFDQVPTSEVVAFYAGLSL